MRKTALVVIVVLSALVSLATAGASGNGSRSDLVYDCGPLTGYSCDSYRDMVGPSVGSVEYAQAEGQGLKLWVQIAGADANAQYDWVLYCGPTHNNSGNFVDFGSPVRTNGNGYGRTSLWVGQAAITAACGPGQHTGHLDLNSGLPSTLSSTPIYFSGRGDVNGD